MSKRVEITPEIDGYIKAAIGDDAVDTSKFAVYEAKSLSTEPITQRGFHDGARLSASVLNQMASHVNTPGNSIPMQIMHNTSVLPIGRVFRGATQEMPNGEVELRTMFYIPLDKQSIVADIDNGVTDEVSVNVLTDHAYCSECDFDYFGEDALMNRLTLACPDGHEIGNGAHARLVGFSNWAELSLVNRGAAKGAKILSHAKQSMGQDMLKKLAASAVPLEARLINSTFKLNHTGDLHMDGKELVAALTTATSEAAGFKIELAASKGENTVLAAANVKLTADLAAKELELAEAKKLAADPAALEAAIAAQTKLEKEMKEATDAVAPHLKAALVASGVAEADFKDKSLPAQLALITEKGLKLHQIITVGGVSEGSKEDAALKASAAKSRSEAFKTTKR